MTMNNLDSPLTLETLPQAFSKLILEVSEIRLLLEEKLSPTELETNTWFGINELSIYHPDKPTRATIYSWVSSGLIPVHKSGKKLRFLKSEIDTWLKQGKKLSNHDSELAAHGYLVNKKG